MEARERREDVEAGAPLGDLARIAAFVAGVSACFRRRDGRVLGEAGALEADAYDLAVPTARPIVVPDATRDARTASHPAVTGAPHVRFWARLPVLDRGGVVLAWLDLADGVPTLLPEDRLDVLATVARQAGAALVAARREPEWRAALFQIPTPVFLLQVEGGPRPTLRFLDGNAAARRIATPEALRQFGGELDAIFPWAAPNRVSERCLRVHRSGVAETFQLPLTTGTIRTTFSVRIFPLPDDFLGVAVEDVTDRTDLQRRKEEFVTVVSHELRTPLASIRGAVGLLEGGVAGPLPDNVTRLVGIAREGTDRLARMLSDLMDLERLRSGLLPLRAEPVTVSELLALATSASAGGARAAGVTVKARMDADAGVIGDRERLAQAFTNLLSNAVKFSPAGGTVRVTVSRPDAGRVRVEVDDEGAGLAPEDLDRIFSPFHTADVPDTRARGGLGLGLAISRFIVEGHGGAIGVVGARDDGATFWIELPVIANGRRADT